MLLSVFLGSKLRFLHLKSHIKSKITYQDIIYALYGNNIDRRIFLFLWLFLFLWATTMHPSMMHTAVDSYIKCAKHFSGLESWPVYFLKNQESFYSSTLREKKRSDTFLTYILRGSDPYPYFWWCVLTSPTMYHLQSRLHFCNLFGDLKTE